jgi:DNA-binding transcriptional ArsR family regulator
VSSHGHRPRRRDRGRAAPGPDQLSAAEPWRRRRISPNATGTAASPASPHTHRASPKPPVSATAGEWPCRRRAWNREAAIDDATATPITLPRFCEVLTRPEATPPSRSATPVSAPIETGMKVNAVPMTTQADDELWSAIADPSRRRVLDLLVSHGDVSASWLAGQVPFTRQAVSKHLAVLEEAGLVSRRKHGREVLYQVEAGRLDQATQAMADLAARWDQRLGAIKRLAEAAHTGEKKSRNS